MASTQQRSYRFARSAAVGMCVVAIAASACSTAPGIGSGDAGPTSSTIPDLNKIGGTISGPADDASPVNGGRLVVGIEAEPEGLVPTSYAFSSSGHMIASAVFDPLATLDANGNAVPYLAKAIDPSDNYQTWTITLPTGVTFHDGTALDAQAVVTDLEAYRKSIITGLSLKTVTSVTATDPTHVVVKLSQPMVAFPAQMTTQPGYIFAPAMLTNPDLAGKPEGTGPYVFDRHENSKVWSFKKNPHYWRTGLPHLDAIDFKPVPDNLDRVSGLQKGDLDVIHTNRPRQVLDLRTLDVKRVENAGGEEDYLILNTQAPPFDNALARQAIAYASDTAKWRTDQNFDVEQPANGPFAPGQLGYVENNGYPTFDLAKAKDLVAQYTAQTGKPFEFTWQTQEDVDAHQETQFFIDLYQQAGMKVSVEAKPQINLVAAIASGSYQMGRFRLFSSANPDVDAESFWESASILPPGNVSLNFPRYQNATIDAAITKAKASTDPQVRDQAYQEVNRQLAQNQPYIWLGRPVWTLAANPKVNGIYAAVNGSVQTIGAKTWLAELWVSR